jgi:hypothetical protein
MVLAVSAAALLAGCGGSGGSGDGHATTTTARVAATPAPTRSPRVGEPKPRTLVFFQRQGAGGATLDTVTVRTDGTARHEKRYGGAGGRFRDLVVRRALLPKLRRALARLPRHGSTLTRGSPPPGGASYLVRVGRRTFTGRAGAIAHRARPSVRLLDGFIDGIGVREYTREHATSAP